VALLMETLAAQHRPVSARHERDYRGGAARRAGDGAFDARPPTLSFGFASLAVLGFVLELLLAKERLLHGAEDELLSTINALQGFVREFHCAYLLDCAIR
jgi:hypothetical protein